MITADHEETAPAVNRIDGTARLILGTVVSNGGDAAILHAQLTLLERALGTARTTIEDNDPVLARQLFPEVGVVEPGRVADAAWRAAALLGRAEQPTLQRVTRRLARRDLPALARRAANASLDRVLADNPLVFYTGGTSLIEQYDLDAKFRNLLRTLEKGRPLVLLPQSVGPFTTSTNIHAMTEVVAGSSLVLLRDERSRRHLEQIGADLSKVRVVPDIVFCLAGPDDVARLGRASIPEFGANVALGIRDCRKFFATEDRDAAQAALERRYAELATHLVRERGAQVTFVSTCQGIERYWTDDSRVAVAVSDLLPDDVRAHCVVDRGFHDTEDLRAVLAKQDLVVANRLHGAILTLSVGVPVVPVEYEFKTREVFRQLEQEEAVYSIDDVTRDSLVGHVEAFVGQWEINRAAASVAFESVVRRAWDTGGVIRRSVTTS